MKKIMLVMMILLGSTGARHSGFEASRLSSYKIPVVSELRMQKIASEFEIVRKLKDGYEVIVPAHRGAELKQWAPGATLIEFDISANLPRMKTGRVGEPSYRSLNQFVSHLTALTVAYPHLAQIVQYGTSQDGHPLLALKVSDQVNSDENEPELMLTAATHGDEIITPEILVNLIDRLLKGYGVDKRMTKMVDDHEIYFIPVVNPDGFVERNRYEHGRDPNRSYPSPEEPHKNPTVSIAKLIEFYSSRNILGSIDFHAYGEMVMYPWAYTMDEVPKEYAGPFDQLAKRMAEVNSYAYGPISKVIYVAKNSSADYYFWSRKTVALAIEVGQSKAPRPIEIQEYTEAQAEPTWRFVESF